MSSITHRLYWNKPYDTRFTAKVLNIRADFVALDQTHFYPAGGGQENDLGFLKNIETEHEIPILGVEKDDSEVIWHKVSLDDLKHLKVGSEVEGVIDWDRRYQLMRSHTSQHVLSAAIAQIAGIQTQQAIIDIDETKLVLEEKISDEKLVQALILSNKICTSSRPVSSKILTPNEAKAQLGNLRNSQIPPGEKIRVVEIANHDKMCCGGTHVRDTIEIGPMHLLERKSKVIVYVVGQKSLEQAVDDSLDFLALSNRLNVPTTRVVATVQTRLDTFQLLQEQRNEAIKALLSCKASEEGIEIGEISFRQIDLTFSDRKIALRELGRPQENQIISVLVENGTFLILSNSKYTAKDLIAEFCKRTDSRGGGGAKQAQCSTKIPNPHQILEEILREYES
ncbi:MAG: alanine--tRNA ligase-related protein [Candidatus Hodarchaeales archaeon]|jgi:Ser-tRNA(Ala) deacylase AlaX